jgi:ABC-type multidrug transport system, ATPase component
VGGECIAWGRGVWKSFGSTIVFADAEFCFRRGMNVLWAPNGSGKSTLIKLLLGILKPDRGVVWIDRRFKLGVFTWKIMWALRKHAPPRSHKLWGF